MTYILGISAYYHDSSAALIKEGEILGAVQEERFSRIKHDSSFPSKSISWLLKSNKINLRDLDYIVFYRAQNTNILDSFFHRQKNLICLIHGHFF